MSKTAILQPSYLPWIGYFEQIDRVDNFIFYDDVQYTKNDWRNRNIIKTDTGTMWLSVPVSFTFGTTINKVLIDNTQPWKRKHLNALKSNYAKAPFYDDIIVLIEKTFANDYAKLSDLNIDLIRTFMAYLNITTKIHLASEIAVAGDKNSRLINMCRLFGTSTYYSGEAAKVYLDTSAFKKNNIHIKLQTFSHMSYPQQFNSNFKSHLSIVDLLFNMGKESINYIRTQNE